VKDGITRYHTSAKAKRELLPLVSKRTQKGLKNFLAKKTNISKEKNKVLVK